MTLAGGLVDQSVLMVADIAGLVVDETLER